MNINIRNDYGLYTYTVYGLTHFGLLHILLCRPIYRIYLFNSYIGWGQLPLSLKAKLNQAFLTGEFRVLNVYLLV